MLPRLPRRSLGLFFFWDIDIFSFFFSFRKDFAPILLDVQSYHRASELTRVFMECTSRVKIAWFSHLIRRGGFLGGDGKLKKMTVTVWWRNPLLGGGSRVTVTHLVFFFLGSHLFFLFFLKANVDYRRKEKEKLRGQLINVCSTYFLSRVSVQEQQCTVWLLLFSILI